MIISTRKNFLPQTAVDLSQLRGLAFCSNSADIQTKEKFLSAAYLTSQIYIFRNFSSRSGKFDDSRTLFVTGLSKDTTEDSLRKYFRKKNWDMTDCRIIRDKMTGASRQFGFVEMATAELASKDRHFIDCKVVSVKMNGNKELEEKYRIFVGGLLKETSKETLHKHFSQFGDVFDCNILYDEDNLSRGFGFVTYKSQDLVCFRKNSNCMQLKLQVDRALNSQPHNIDSQVVTVKHATIRPRDLTIYGQLTQSEVSIDRKTGLSRGFGFIGFASKEELERARSAHPHIIDGVKVTFHSKGQNLVVDSLSPNITEDSLQKFFSQYGQVQDCRINTNSIGTTTAYVIMSNEEETSRALADRPHRIKGKLVSTHLKGKVFTILIYDLPSNTTDDALCQMFSKVAKPIHWQVIRNLKLNADYPTINGYVSFSSPEEVDRVMERSDQYSINGKLLTIQRKEKFLSATNLRHLTSQIHTVQNFSSSSEYYKFDDSRTVMVAGLSKDTTEDSLQKYFRKKNWAWTKCRIARDKMTGASLQYGFVEMATVEEAELASKNRHFIDCKVVSVKMKGGKEFADKYQIFVGGLLRETSKETLLNHFSQFGDIFECHIAYNEDNISREFGFVTYKSQDSVDRALNSRPHFIDNKVVDVNHTPPRRREFTLFIGNLSPKTTDESLRDHFSKYGQLRQCNVNIDLKTGQSRGFGHVAFASKEEFERARSAHPHTIDGVEISFHTKGQDLVIDSLAPNITKDSLQKFFSQYGQVQDCAITKNSIGTTTAFVTMSNEEETARALADRPHYINGKLVDTHLKGKQFTLLLYDLPSNTTDKDLEETFSKVCKPIHWQVLRNRKLNANFPTINGYVSFSSAEEVDRVMEHQPYYSINGEPLIIQRQLWKGRMRK
ncbi:RNA recognition motif domain-containing protein [Ditylenchus destructor]|nr:RNA recognition motif domain-containing protein [Ditylenchus destructor]